MEPPSKRRKLCEAPETPTEDKSSNFLDWPLPPDIIFYILNALTKEESFEWDAMRAKMFLVSKSFGREIARKVLFQDRRGLWNEMGATGTLKSATIDIFGSLRCRKGDVEAARVARNVHFYSAEAGLLQNVIDFPLAKEVSFDRCDADMFKYIKCPRAKKVTLMNTDCETNLFVTSLPRATRFILEGHFVPRVVVDLSKRLVIFMNHINARIFQTQRFPLLERLSIQIGTSWHTTLRVILLSTNFPKLKTLLIDTSHVELHGVFEKLEKIVSTKEQRSFVFQPNILSLHVPRLWLSEDIKRDMSRLVNLEDLQVTNENPELTFSALSEILPRLQSLRNGNHIFTKASLK